LSVDSVWLPVSRGRLKVKGYRLQVTGFRLQVISFRLQVTGFKLWVMDLSGYLDVAIRAAEEASRKILEVYQSDDFDIEAKDDGSPLTRADKSAHECILGILKETNLPVLSEEGRGIPYEERKNWSRLWLVDPLDGTKEFIKRNGEFTVNIALIENQLPVLGVVAVPVTGFVYYGASQSGAFVKKENTIKQLTRKSTVDLLTPQIRVVGSRSHMNDETARFIQSLKQPILVSKGSSLKFMLLAEGEADIYPRFAPTMEWDTAAPHAIMNLIGVKVYLKDSLMELVYNKESLLNPSFLCG
jgi:3'(2'), 5'-bisphosphate nucleotidase